MQGTVVEEGASLYNVIVDKGAVITAGKELKGVENWPIIVGKNTIV
jgi:ADP-glucose pyrophosphorylase